MSIGPENALEAARIAADLLLALADIVGASPQELIDQAAVKRANRIADGLEDAKFGPEKTGDGGR